MSPTFSLAGFQVTLIGRFWVTLERGRGVLRKAITVVKGKVVDVAGAVGKWESRSDFARAFLARLFHSLSPAAWSSFVSLLSRFLAHRFAAHFDAMSVVHQPVEDAIGQRGIADLLVPAGHR